MAVQRDSESSKLIGTSRRSAGQDSGPKPPVRSRPRVAVAVAVADSAPTRGSRRAVSIAADEASAEGSGDAAAKLALLEALLEVDDASDCAQRAVSWLCERARVKQAMCAVVDQERAKLVGVAGHGFTPASVRQLSIDLNDASHRIVSALASGAPVVFRRNVAGDIPATPFGGASFTAFPLEGGPLDRERRPGVLLTGAVSPQVAREARWLAGVLGRRLTRLARENAPARAYELDLKVRAATAALMQQNELLNQQNELLNQQRLALEQASSLKSQFLANMSHEFRTPLNAILGYTSMLLQGMGGELNAQQTQMLMRVDSNSRNLLSLINDILDISRIEAGKMPLHFAEFRVTDVVTELLAELESMIARSRLAVKTELKEVPALRSDRQKVKQILLNLITNALKFTPKGSVTITTGYDPSVRQVTVDVADTGIGISERDQEKLFNDFQQADSSPTRQYGGAGLGLSICRRLAAMLGGHITLNSKLEQGSTFTLVLPRQARHR